MGKALLSRRPRSAHIDECIYAVNDYGDHLTAPSEPKESEVHTTGNDRVAARD
jgi:hypothetical protein